jgi:hypothetical protein
MPFESHTNDTGGQPQCESASPSTWTEFAEVPQTRGTENAYRGGCTVDTTTRGRPHVTCKTL